MQPNDLSAVLKQIGNRLHEKRTQNKEKICNVAHSLDISDAAVSLIENGRYPGLGVKTLILLCNHYNMPISEILGT